MYVALIVVVLDFIALPGGSNTGGHFAHLGGALFGLIMIWGWRTQGRH